MRMRRRSDRLWTAVLWLALGYCIGQLTWLIIDSPSTDDLVRVRAESNFSRLPDATR